MKSKIYNPVEILYQRYYREQDGACRANHVSSHWEHYGQYFHAEMDRIGKLVSADGVGFGSCTWGSTGNRLLNQSAILVHLMLLGRREDISKCYTTAKALCRKMELDPTLDVFRQACSAELLMRYVNQYIRRQNLRVLMIGDGYGVLSSLFKAIYPDAKMTLVDLGQTLLVQALRCEKAHPETSHSFANEDVDQMKTDFLYCPADETERLLQNKYDVAVNIVSMQEMNLESIAGYFEILRSCLVKQNLFYCCNREYKELVGGEITEIKKYPWTDKDEIYFDEPCPWHKFYFSRTKTKRGLMLGKYRIPLVNYYDGPISHRMVRMRISE